jgi:peptide chain release factor 2
MWDRVDGIYEDLSVLAEILSEEADDELQKEFTVKSAGLKKLVEKEQLMLLLSEEYDGSSAILSVHAGSGGLDSQDWAEMLLRLYLRWAEREGFRARIIEILQDEEAGIKNATVLVEGDFAYGYLKSEKGVHRLVRISPFDAGKRRHTSFASVDVAPELPDDVEVEVRPEDLKVDTYRASGAGGQYVNKTDSAVRITHLPTGIVVACQNERSQHMNRQVAMQVLRSRLFEMAVRERQQELQAIQGEKKEISWGSQIRSYVLQPYTLVKDYRTGHETGNVQAVLDGDIDDFIMSYLRWKKQN